MRKVLWSVAAITFLVLPIQAMSAPNIVIGTDSISSGEAASIDLTFAADGVVAGLDFKFSYNDTEFDATAACAPNLPTTGTGVATVVCQATGGVVSVLVSAPLEFPVPQIVAGSQSLGSITFQSQGSTAPGAYALDITEENFFDNGSSPVTGSGSTNGSITVVEPPAQPPAIFGSTPAAGSTVDMTAAGDVLVGGTVPPSMLTLSNTAAAGAQSLTGLSCTKSGSAAITVAPAVSGVSLAPGASTDVTFSCATTGAGSFSASYDCDYTTDSTGDAPVTGTASYTYTCDVVPPKSVVAPQIPSGTTLTRTALFGGSASFSVGFDETANQGVDGDLTCSLATSTDFVLNSTMPATIPSGGSFSVMVTGTASSDPLNPMVTDTLNCTYTDTDNTAGVDVSYPLVLRSVNITRPVNVPTLSQWGMAIMALVLLGVGMVGFRRYH